MYYFLNLKHILHLLQFNTLKLEQAFFQSTFDAHFRHQKTSRDEEMAN